MTTTPVTAPPTDASNQLTAATTPFSTVIREASRGEHSDAESTGFAQALVEGRLHRDAYAALLGQEWLVYLVLEEAAEAQRADPVGATFWFPELLRVPSMEQDLEFLYGGDWRTQVEPRPATERYCERVRAVCFDWAGGFMAHQYTRYLGDLSGGQIISRNLQKVYNLDRDGLRFYWFEDIPKPKRFKDLYRGRVDAAPWDDDEHARIVHEIKAAFRLNTELYNDIGSDYERYLLPD